MKKFTLLTHTRAVLWLNLIPPAALTALAIIFNDSVETFPKLYPLIIVMAAITVFIAVFLLRVLYVSTEDVRMIGPFSSRDRALIKKNTEIRLTLQKKGRVKFEFLGEDKGAPVFDWMKTEGQTQGVCIMRETVYGGERAVRRALKIFGIANEAADNLLTKDGYSITVDGVDATSAHSEEERTVTLKITKIL